MFGAPVALSAIGAVSGPAMTFMTKIIMFFVFIILFGIVILIFLFFYHMPPRAWTFGYPGEDTAIEILDTTSDMFLRLEAEYGDEIQKWFEKERSGNTEVYKSIVKEWYARADESYITRTYITANASKPESKDVKCKFSSSVGCDVITGARDCDDVEMICERPYAKPGVTDACIEANANVKNKDIECKDFPEKIFDECPRVGVPPCYVSDNSRRRREGDLFFGKPGNLDTSKLRTDFDIWFNLKDNDMVKPVMEADKPKMKSIERVELFMAALPWFYKSISPRYDVFRYCSPVEISDSKDYIESKTKLKTMFIRKYEIFKNDKSGMTYLINTLKSGRRVICDTRTDLFDSIVADVQLMREILKRVPLHSIKIELDDPSSLRKAVDYVIKENQKQGSPLYLSHSCWTCLNTTSEDLELAIKSAESGDIKSLKISLANSVSDFSSAIDRLVQIRNATEGKLRIMSGSVYPELEYRKTKWNDVIDIVNFDESDIQRVYDTIKDIDSREVLSVCKATGRSEVLEADYKRFINLLRTVVYIGTYVVESKKYANLFHINPELSKRFYETIYHDLSCSYIHKGTGKPHKSETGLVYNVQSTREFCREYWNYEEMHKNLIEGTKNIVDRLSKACGF
jgi:hypothetical protein